MHNRVFRKEQYDLEQQSNAIIRKTVDLKRYQLIGFFSWLANRIANEKTYPSNVLDAIIYILSIDKPSVSLNNFWNCGIPNHILELAYNGMFGEADEKLIEYRQLKK